MSEAKRLSPNDEPQLLLESGPMLLREFNPKGVLRFMGIRRAELSQMGAACGPTCSSDAILENLGWDGLFRWSRKGTGKR